MTANQPDDPTPEELAHATPAVVRRAPRFRAFAVAGFLVGAAVATVLALVRPAPAGAALDTTGMWLVLTVVLGGFGVLVASAVAVAVDRRSRRLADRAAGRPVGRERRRRR